MRLYWIDPYQLQEGKPTIRVFYAVKKGGAPPILGLLYVARERLPALEEELKAQGYRCAERLREIYGKIFISELA